jgi:hypothetical protein
VLPFLEEPEWLFLEVEPVLLRAEELFDELPRPEEEDRMLPDRLLSDDELRPKRPRPPSSWPFRPLCSW